MPELVPEHRIPGCHLEGFLETAYDGNLSDYKDTIPHLFWHNALIILSNGSQSRVGSTTAGWEHFAEWKKIGSEDEEGKVSLEARVSRGERGADIAIRARILVQGLDRKEIFLRADKSARYGAVVKALAAAGGQGSFWQDIEIIHEQDGRPHLELGGRLRELAEGLGVRTLHVSLTHTAEVGGWGVLISETSWGPSGLSRSTAATPPEVPT